MKIKLRWSDGATQEIGPIPEDCPLVKSIRDGSVFDSVQSFAHKTIYFNMALVQQIEILED